MNFSNINPAPLKTGCYSSDLFNERPLFLIKNSRRKVVVKSWIESYCLIDKFSTNDVNPRFVAEYLTETYSTLTSPYKNIKRLPRHSNIKINLDGSLEIENYNPFLSKYKSLSEDDLHNQIRNKIIQKLNNLSISGSENIGVEHSSGLDSNSILGCLLLGNNINRDFIHTYSRKVNYETEEINQLRKLFNLKPENCHYSFYQSDLDESKRSIEILGFPPIIYPDIQELEILKKYNCKYILSGLGGDQCLSNSGKNIIVDILNNDDYFLAKKWLGGYLPLLKYLIKKNSGLNNFKSRFTKNNLLGNKFIERLLSPEGINFLSPFLKKDINYSFYPNHFTALKQGLMSEWLSLRYEQEKNLAKAFGLKKEFPLLDIDLLSLVLKQDPMFFADNHFSGRKLLNKSMSIYFPKEISKKKNDFLNFNHNNYSKTLNTILNKNLNDQLELHPLTNKLFRLELLYEIGEKLVQKKYINIQKIRLFNISFKKIKELNLWFKYIDNCNLRGPIK